MSGKAKCANCALAEKQKNAGGAKIKSFRVGLCVAFFRSMSVGDVIIFSFFNVCLSRLQCLLPLLTTVEAICSKGLRATYLSRYPEVYAGQNA